MSSQQGENVGGEGGGVGLGKNVPHLAIGADDVGDAPGVLGLARIGRAVLRPDRAAGVAEERVGELELLGEGPVLLYGVEADAQDGGILRG